ncbi:MAG: NUDIX domain-containing protein [Thermoguttaceae bacterium]|jgi:8-oxo-dGTP diphosphatase
MTHPFDDGCRRRGVVAVVVRQGRFLVIRRAAAVVAPGMVCFPGGAGEGAETEEETLVREIREELGVAIEPIRRVWRSVTPWQVELSWWLSRIAEGELLRPNPAEVASVHWQTAGELRRLPNLLESNHHFLDALDAGEIQLG